MRPSLEDYTSGATTWKRDHKGVSYTLSHHGISDYNNQGTWCFYIHIHDNIFVNPDDFKLFDREAELVESFGRYRESYEYYTVPDYGFNGGITWYSKDYFVDRDGTKRTTLKIGCDYAHLWDMERGYPDTLETVDFDARKLIDELVENHPVKQRCSYSGKLDTADKFYTAKNGALVHESQEAQFTQDNWPTWMRAA